jgi:pimeloyl-ACP methyl ester carboxylesterase
MKIFYSIVLLLLLGGVVRAQDLGVIHGQARLFRLKDRDGDIEFIKLDTSIREKKPVFLFCQGSLPLPLFVQDPTYGVYMIGGGITNFDRKAIEKDYHFIVISMPHVPVTVPSANTNSSMCYIPDTTRPNVFAPDYERADYLENYVKRAEKVLKYLKKQPWVDHSRLVVAGHSQGAKIAAKLGARDKSITHVGLFGANPFGRVDQYVRQARKQAEKGRYRGSRPKKPCKSNMISSRRPMLPNAQAVTSPPCAPGALFQKCFTTTGSASRARCMWPMAPRTWQRIYATWRPCFLFRRAGKSI